MPRFREWNALGQFGPGAYTENSCLYIQLENGSAPFGLGTGAFEPCKAAVHIVRRRVPSLAAIRVSL